MVVHVDILRYCGYTPDSPRCRTARTLNYALTPMTGPIFGDRPGTVSGPLYLNLAVR